VTAALAALAVALAAACVTVPPSGQASAKKPVVLVHGYIEGNIIWGTLQTSFKAAGYKTGDITNFAYDSTGANQASAAATAATALGRSVDAALAYARANGNPSATKVDIVSHSYGSMVTRYCIALGSCAGKVDHWMSLAGADGGTSIAVLPALIGQGSGRDMSPNSATVQLLKRPENIQKIKDQGVKVRVQWSPNDGIISPARNSLWPSPENPDPAANVQLPGTVNHLNIFNNQAAIAETLRFFGT
jgi:triacylglycerol lipase